MEGPNRSSARLQALLSQLSASSCSSSTPSASDLRWNGWGYADTAFHLNQNGHVVLSGNRYEFSGVELPEFRPFMEARGVRVENKTEAKLLSDIILADPVDDKGLLATLPSSCNVSQEKIERLRHSHGHSLQEIYALRCDGLERYVDSVLYPSSIEDVEFIVKKCFELDIVIIPFGGGTSVTQALLCPQEESRHIVSLDMTCMSAIKWIDSDSMSACIESGAIGRHIETSLGRRGFCLGHEPDSHEFSSLGGWVATRASGMKKNAYGNIEDIVQSITMVTPTGVVCLQTRSPRQSCGPDVLEMIMGSEGTLGVIVDAVVRIHRIPEQIDFGTLIFPDFECGASFMHELALQSGPNPVSVRLVDNTQFLFSLAIKPADHSWTFPLKEKIKKWYVESHLGFDMNRITAATLLFEGSTSEVAAQKHSVFSIAKKFGGYYGGSEPGRRGYNLTFMIAYVRDFALDYNMLGESFETSMEWKNVLPLCTKVKERIALSCKERNLPEEPFISCRITQIYETGACVYFYFAIVAQGVEKPDKVFSEIEDEARAEVLRCGGSLSHHHGVGKLRKHFMPQVLSRPALRMLQAIKRELDPTNVFAAGNLIDED